jgi:hypothetical protein
MSRKESVAMISHKCSRSEARVTLRSTGLVAFEQLETRVLPAPMVLTWTGLSQVDGNWTTRENWNQNDGTPAPRGPDDGDTIVFTTIPSGGRTLSIMNEYFFELARLFIYGPFLGTLRLLNAVNVTGYFSMGSGTIEGPGDLIITTLAEPESGTNSKWYGGTIGGNVHVSVEAPPLPDRGRLDILADGGVPTLDENATLSIENRTDVYWQKGNFVVKDNAGILIHGNFWARSTGVLGDDSLTGTIGNYTSFIQDDRGTTTIKAYVNNHGARGIVSARGTLVLLGGGASSGQWFTSTGTAISFTDAGEGRSYRWDQGTTLSGTGVVKNVEAVIYLTSDAQVPVESTLQLFGGEIDVGNQATVRIDTAFEFIAGTLREPGRVRIGGTANATLGYFR